MNYRNVAIIAHVDHGKTTLVDHMLRQAGVFAAHQQLGDRIMDSYALERERGITILAKNTALRWRDAKINIVDTPGHADFGGEVERALAMVDGVLLLVDAAEGPMPQTRFVLRKAIDRQLRPMLVVNKVDRRDARPDRVVDLTFDLMVELGASEEQLDFPILLAVAREGRAWLQGNPEGKDLHPLLDTILAQFPPATSAGDGPFRMQVAQLDYSDYVGRLAIGRVLSGALTAGQDVVLARPGRSLEAVRINRVYTHLGLERLETRTAETGDIVALAGLADVRIGDTVCAPEAVEALPVTSVEEPTVSVSFLPNTSPFAGRDGTFVTGRQVAERLQRELLTNVAMRLEILGGEAYRVSGRGELHLSILIEQMRREGYEFSVSRPEVIFREVNGERQEPYEQVVTDVPAATIGAVIELLASRRGQLVDMEQGPDRGRLVFRAPSRGLFGLRTAFLSLTQGEGLLSHVFHGYGPVAGEIATRSGGSLVAMEGGEAFAYSLFKLQDRGAFFITPGTEVYVGMIVGQNSRPGDLNVNVCKNKKLTNVRAAGSDDNLLLTPVRRLTLEECLGFLAEDELLEVTPGNLRLRKRILDPTRRKRHAGAAGQV